VASDTYSLIDQLYADPEQFFKLGRANDLLDKLCQNKDFRKLEELLNHQDMYVLRSGIWILAELGAMGVRFVGYAIQLLSSDDFYVRFFSLEAIAHAAVGSESSLFKYVLEYLSDKDDRVRWKAMKLASRASIDQLRIAKLEFEKQKPTSYHMAGIQMLIDSHRIRSESREAASSNDLLRKTYSLLEVEVTTKGCKDQLVAGNYASDKNLSELCTSLLSLKMWQADG